MIFRKKKPVVSHYIYYIIFLCAHTNPFQNCHHFFFGGVGTSADSRSVSICS